MLAIGKDVNEYRIIDPLGSGSFAEVHLCEKPVSREKFALKVFNKSKLVRQRSGTFGPRGLLQVTTAMDQVAEEIAIMKKVKSLASYQRGCLSVFADSTPASGIAPNPCFWPVFPCVSRSFS